MDSILEILGLMALSSIKFLFAPGTTMLAGYNFLETVLITSLGGISGVLIFYYFGEIIFREIQKWINKRRKKEKVKRAFSRRNRLIVKTKITYGLLGLALITPTVLSIPIGSVMAARFFRNNKLTIPVLIVSVMIWSLLITGVFSLGILEIKR